MAKIKGWRNTKDIIFRDGVLGEVFVSNKKRTLVVGKTVVIDGEKLIHRFKTKKQALAYAINYMRSHPNG